MVQIDHFTCKECREQYYGDDVLFDLTQEGKGHICENCFLDYVKTQSLCQHDDVDEEEFEHEWDAKDIADNLKIYYTTVDNYLDNLYALAMEERAEAKNEMMNEW